MSTFTMETLTPVHIGSGVFLQRDIEYLRVHTNSGNSSFTRLGIIDEAKVLEIIGTENVDKWLSIIENRDNLYAYLKSRKPDLKLADVSSRTIHCYTENKQCLTLKEQIHDGCERPYIPGSSIKGAIRSALLNQIILANGKRIKEDEIKIFKGQFSANTLEKKIFGNNPNSDIFRYFQVGDALFDKNTTVGLRLCCLNIVSNGDETILDQKSAQLVETIGADVKAFFSIKLDSENGKNSKLFNEFEPFVSINRLFDFINMNTLHILEGERKFWEDDVENDYVEAYVERINDIIGLVNKLEKGECILRLGHGMGWSFINGNWTKDDSILSDQIFERIKNAARPNNHRYSEYPFPKTRRVDEDVDLLGFVKIKEI